MNLVGRYLILALAAAFFWFVLVGFGVALGWLA